MDLTKYPEQGTAMVIPEGQYLAYVEEIKKKVYKSGKPGYTVKWKIVEGPFGGESKVYKNMHVFENFPEEVEFRMGQLRLLARVAGLKDEQLRSWDTNFGLITDVSLKIRLKKAKQDSGEYRNEVIPGAYYPASGSEPSKEEVKKDLGGTSTPPPKTDDAPFK